MGGYFKPECQQRFCTSKASDEYHITPAETMVFGDYNNDLEMLAISDFSFAMENAHPNVKDNAKYHTLSNDNYGVEVVLEKLLSQI